MAVAKRRRKPWILRLPQGIRNNPAWIFIGGLFAISGLSLMFGLAEPTTISRALPPFFLNVWGGCITAGGLTLVWATVRIDFLLEKFILRVLSVLIILYGGWAIAVVGLSRAAVTSVLILMLSVIFEIRLAVINLVVRGVANHERN